MTAILEEHITEMEAQQLLDAICSKFNVLAKCYGVDGLNDVSYLEVHGLYDDSKH